MFDVNGFVTRCSGTLVAGRVSLLTRFSSIAGHCGALGVIKKQRALTGLLKHEHVFARSDSEPFNDLQLQWRRWVFTHKRLGIRYREPYQMRHTSVTWNLMIGENLLKVAQQHGHSAAVMLKVYARWIAGSTDEDVDGIRRAMGFGTRLALAKSKNK